VSRRQKHEEHENYERWLVSYADFITLLFAFFVVLYATSSQNEEKEKKFEDSIRAQFKMVGNVGDSQSQTGGMLGQVIDPIDVFQNKNVGNGELEDYVQRIIQKNMSEEERKLAIGGLRHDSMGVRISLAASTFFPVGSSKLRLPALRSLDKVANILKASGRRLIIEGHTDNQQIVGGQIDSNWELASLRATSVVRYLIKYHGIESKRLAAISYADTKPLVPNTTDENRAKNRRIEILIVNNNSADEN
jgi:chemotaxis protein MotB